MASLNKVQLIGYLGKDPEIKYLQSGTSVASFSIATQEKIKDGDTKTEWHNISAFGRLAEVCNEYLRKGSMVYVEGRIQTRKWEKDGSTHYKTEIVIHQMQMLDRQQQQGQGGRRETRPEAEQGSYDDDVPF